LTIGWLYATYHLLREPETTIYLSLVDKMKGPIKWPDVPLGLTSALPSFLLQIWSSLKVDKYFNVFSEVDGKNPFGQNSVLSWCHQVSFLEAWSTGRIFSNYFLSYVFWNRWKVDLLFFQIRSWIQSYIATKFQKTTLASKFLGISQSDAGSEWLG